MRIWAEIDAENIVTRVLVVDNNKDKTWLEEKLGGTWIESRTESNATSVETKNFAGVGYTYNAQINAFMQPKPYPSWVINADLASWEAPVPKPNDDATWNEDLQEWTIA